MMQKRLQNQNDFTIPVPLDTDFFNELTLLEETFYSHEILMEQISQLVQMLAKAVEYYDCTRDPIKVYFQDKIQFVLSRQQIMNKIQNNQQPKDNRYIRKDLKNSLLISDIMEFEENDSGHFQQEKSRFEKIAQNNQHQQLKKVDTLPVLQKRKIRYQFQANQIINQHLDVDQEQAKNIVSNLQNNIIDVNQIIQNSLQKQESDFRKRLEKRKNPQVREKRSNTTEKHNIFTNMAAIKFQKEKQINIQDINNEVQSNYKQITGIIQKNENFMLFQNRQISSRPGSIDYSRQYKEDEQIKNQDNYPDIILVDEDQEIEEQLITKQISKIEQQ